MRKKIFSDCSATILKDICVNIMNKTTYSIVVSNLLNLSKAFDIFDLQTSIKEWKKIWYIIQGSSISWLMLAFIKDPFLAHCFFTDTNDNVNFLSLVYKYTCANLFMYLFLLYIIQLVVEKLVIMEKF